LFIRFGGFTNKEEKKMESVKTYSKNKGGRPLKALRKSQVISLKCSAFDKAIIKAKAKKANLSASEYLLEISRNGTIVVTEKQLPGEVLKQLGAVHHMAANLNQLAKKSNSVTDELSAAERFELQVLSGELKLMVQLIKNYLR
jgi:hypothetical protein